MNRSEENTWRITQGKQPLKPMEDIVAYIQEYIRTYSSQEGYEDYSDELYIDDMLYAIGVSMKAEYKFRRGFVDFKATLLNKLLADPDLKLLKEQEREKREKVS